MYNKEQGGTAMGFMNRPKDNKSSLVGIRFTPSQVEAMKICAEVKGLNLSEWTSLIILENSPISKMVEIIKIKMS